MLDWRLNNPAARPRRAAGLPIAARLAACVGLGLGGLAACSTPTPPPVEAAAPVRLTSSVTNTTASAIPARVGQGPARSAHDEDAFGGGPSSSAPGVLDRQLVATLAWGSGEHALGKHEGPEQNPTAPMAIAASQHGLWILDQVNGRIVQLQGARESATLVHSTPVGLADPYDLALDNLALALPTLLVLDRQVDGAVVALQAGAAGERWRLDLRGDGRAVFDPSAAPGPSGIGFGGGITSLFVHDGGVWVEWAHERSHRLGALDGSRLGIGATIPGRPDLRFAVGLTAERLGDHVIVSGRALAASRAEALEPEFRVAATFPHPVLALRALESDHHGSIWVVANILREQANGQIVAEGLDVVQISPSGDVLRRDSATLEQGPHEQARTFSADLDGTLWHLARRNDGLVVERWRQ